VTDLKEMGSSELLEAWAEYLGQTSTLKTQAAAAKRPKQGRQLWAAARDVEEKADTLKAEVYRRMGVPMIGKTPGLVVYAASRHHKSCEKCGGNGGMNGRYLHWHTVDDATPLPYMQAREGASKKQVMETIEQCILLCRKCAIKKGAKFDAVGKPKL
jgi:hypothetical protein